ncbi:MAG: hypothetical protein M0Z66_13615 [Thermaerobacter sp.]|nr:hypothetical protein [Thermaerobacter sp.]
MLQFVVAGSLIVIYLLFSWFFLHRMTAPVAGPEGTPADFGLKSIPVEVTGDSRAAPTLQGWYLPVAQPLGALVVAPLFGETWATIQGESVVDLWRGLMERGLAVLILDYPGVGRSGGNHQTIGGEWQVVARGARWLSEQGFDWEQIAAAGFSIGTFAALYASRSVPIAAVWADGAVDDLVRAFPREFPFAARLLLPGVYVLGVATGRLRLAALHLLRYIDAVPCRVQFVWGAEEPSHRQGLSRGLQAWSTKCGSVPWIIPSARHCRGAALLKDAYAERLAKFALAPTSSTARTGSTPAPSSRRMN